MPEYPLLGCMLDFQRHLDEAKEIKAKQAIAQKLLDFQAEWGAKISEITEQKYGLAYIPVGWGAELWVMGLGDEPFAIEKFPHEPLIDEIFSAIYGECSHPPDATCKTCESVAEAIYGDEVTKHTVAGYEFPADEETVKAAVERYS